MEPHSPECWAAPSIRCLSHSAARLPLVFWLQAFGSWGDTDGYGNAATAKRSIGGFLSGVYTALGHRWRVGVALSYSRSNVSGGTGQIFGEIASNAEGLGLVELVVLTSIGVRRDAQLPCRALRRRAYQRE